MEEFVERKTCKVQKILEDWGLDDNFSNFEAEGITEDSFELLDESTIKKLFPKSGPRLIFSHKYSKYLNDKNSNCLTDSQIIDLDILDQRSIASCSTISVETYSDSSDIILEPDEETQKLIESFNRNENKTFLKPPSPQREYIKESETPVVSYNKKTKIDSVFPSGGITSVLRKHTDGQIALANSFKLTNDSRQKIVKVLINELISLYGFEIKASTFLRVSEEIEQCFINEKAYTYYIPYVPGSKNKKGYGPKGKLWSRYVNVKSALRNANNSTPKNKCIEVMVSPEKSRQEEEYIDFLKGATEPFDKIIEAWTRTSKIRRRKYMNQDLECIFAEFPCMKLNTGLQLVEIDFDVRFPDQSKIVFENWPKICAAIVKEVKERNINIGNTVFKDLSVHALMTLSYLFSPTTIKRTRKGDIWRPTRSEVQESFFLHVTDYNTLIDRLAARKSKLAEYGIAVQPLACVLGSLENPDAYYIVINEHTFKVDSSIRTLELLYKVFHSLDLEYPPECEAVWLFIQEMVFKMPSVKKNSSTTAVISDIKYHIVATK